MSVLEKMTALADAIRSRTGGTALLTLDQMIQAVAEITGEGTALPRAETLILPDPEGGLYLETGGKGIQFSAYLPAGSGELIVDENTEIITKVSADDLGDAKASDVQAGKTFTSASGLKVTGTMEV